MKNKIYSELFKFADIKSWREIDTSRENVSTLFVSEYYKEYKLEFIKKIYFWWYVIYSNDRYGDYSSSPCYVGIITLSILGKILCTVVLFIALCIAYIFIPKLGSIYLMISIFLALSHFLSYFAVSIFNWGFYKKLRNVQFYIANAATLQKKEEDEILKREVVKIINKKIGEDPKLARKIKLDQLNKIK